MRFLFKLSPFILLLWVSVKAYAYQEDNTESPRLTLINDDWEYLESNAKSPVGVESSEDWEAVSLPHSWNSHDATDMIPGYRRDVSWYRKVLEAEFNDKMRYSLYFEGVNITSEVFVNGTKTGEHIGGYVGFEIDITDHLLPENNEISVRVSNAQNREVIPSSKSDFFIFGGITRDVWLKEVSREVFVEQLQVLTPEVSAESGQTALKISLGGNNPTDYDLHIDILDPKGQVVMQKSASISSENQMINLVIDQPELWHVDHPNLYTANVKVKKGKETIDEINETYGYRWFEFKEHGAFYLNGERLKLRGTHRHEEHAGYGAAIPNALHRQDMQMIKEMGANMIRLGHYPQDPEVYKTCDELGIVVWDELPWCRGGIGNDAWKDNTKRLLTEMIEQNYNHPSIVFWSLGNEVYWLPDFENGDNREDINTFLIELNDLAHDLDQSRLTSIRKYYEGADIPDVFSPSIWSGWYSGKYTDYQASIDAARKKYKRFIHAEYGGSSHVGRHNEEIKSLDNQIQSTLGNEAIIQVNQINYAQDGDWSENYMVDLMDWHLMVTETTPEFAGNLQWAFKDFGTPLRPENDIPYMNQKGLVDREGNPKDVYYVYKSYWSDDPFTYIESATWTERFGEKDEMKEVSVYSNCPEVEFFLNGSSLGAKSKDIKSFPASGLNWDVAFQEGANELVSIGSWKGKLVYDTLKVNYHNSPPAPPAKLELSYAKQSNGSMLIRVMAVDKTGRLSTTYQEKVYFQSLSGGELKQNYGTPTGSSVIALANGQAAIEFYPDADADKAMLTVLNQDFKGTFLEIPLIKTVNSDHP